MNNIQINGQRRWGPPESWTGPPPPHGTEIFVKNLPEQVFEMELYATFSCAGTVYEVRLPVNWDGLNRGYAFVRFTTVQEADEAIDTLDGYEIRRNRKIKVTRSVDNTRLFLSAVPIEKNANDLKRDLLNYVENIKKVYVYPTLENRSLFRGYAFVEFETHRDAAIAKRILTPDVCYGIFQKKCIAAWANPLPFLDRSLLKSLNVLFMRNIPKDMKGFHLKKAIENLTGGEEIKRVKKMNNFAFLTFKDHKSAERALIQLQSIPFFISDHETQVEWAIPREIISTSFSNPEREEYEDSEMTRKGLQGFSKECIRDLGISTLRKTQFPSRLRSPSQFRTNVQEFSTTSSLIVSTERDGIPPVGYVDNMGIIYGESGAVFPKWQRGKDYEDSRRSLLSPLTLSSSSNINSKIIHKNLCHDSSSLVDISENNSYECMSTKGAFRVGSSDKSFDEITSPNVSSRKNLDKCSFFPKNFNPENIYSSEETTRTDKTPYSPFSPSAMTIISSESSLQSPFFSSENSLFPSFMYEEKFFGEENRNIDNSESDSFENEPSLRNKLGHFGKIIIF